MLDYIIVGQGIAGTSIAFRMIQADKKILVIDPAVENATIVAAGNINPITGRNYAKSWMIDELIDEANIFYSDLSSLIGELIIETKPIYRPLRTIKEENQWMARVEDPEYDGHTQNLDKVQDLEGIIEQPVSYGKITKALQINTSVLIPKFRDYLINSDSYLQEFFEYDKLIIREEGVSYNGIQSKYIIFADGHNVTNNPYFSYLPVEPTKGEALIVDFEPKLKHNLRDRTFISPIEEGYWIGSDYEWEFEDGKPSIKGANKIKSQLDSVLKVSYVVKGHLAGIRPCVHDRRPLLGRHTVHNNLAVFNGMGTKGTSLAPFFSKVLFEHLEFGSEIPKEVDIKRF